MEIKRNPRIVISKGCVANGELSEITSLDEFSASALIRCQFSYKVITEI